MKVEFWTFWGSDWVCSKHSSLEAAEREARRCEKAGGMPHVILRVSFVSRKRQKVRNKT